MKLAGLGLSMLASVAPSLKLAFVTAAPDKMNGCCCLPLLSTDFEEWAAAKNKASSGLQTHTHID